MKRQLTIYFTYIFFVSVSIMTYSCKSDSRSKKNTGSGTSFDNRRSALMLDLIRAEEMFAAGKLHQALGLIDELLSKKPQWADPYLLKGNIYTAVGQHDQARSAYEKLVRIDRPTGYYPAIQRQTNHNYADRTLLYASRQSR